MLRMFINMDQSVDRRKVIEDQLARLGVKAERVAGVNGRALSDEQCRELTYPHDHFETKVRFTRDLTKGEIGCFLSHRECWKRLVASDERWGLIIEDDALFSERARVFFEDAEWVPQGIDVVQLHVTHPNEKGLIAPPRILLDKSKGSAQLVTQLTPIPLTTMCYMISREGAQLALLLSKRLPAPVDDFLFSPWFEFVQHMPVWNLYPAVAHAADVESEIGQRNKKSVHKAPFWIRHGLTRFLMDRRIKQHQKQGEEFLMSFK